MSDTWDMSAVIVAGGPARIRAALTAEVIGPTDAVSSSPAKKIGALAISDAESVITPAAGPLSPGPRRQLGTESGRPSRSTRTQAPGTGAAHADNCARESTDNLEEIHSWHVGHQKVMRC
jgi:hypothetical protein